MAPTHSTDDDARSEAETARSRWQSRYEKSRVRDVDFTTLSGVEVEPAYGTDDVRVAR